MLSWNHPKKTCWQLHTRQARGHKFMITSAELLIVQRKHFFPQEFTHLWKYEATWGIWKVQESDNMNQQIIMGQHQVQEEMLLIQYYSKSGGPNNLQRTVRMQCFNPSWTWTGSQLKWSDRLCFLKRKWMKTNNILFPLNNLGKADNSGSFPRGNESKKLQPVKKKKTKQAETETETSDERSDSNSKARNKKRDAQQSDATPRKSGREKK